MMKKTIGAVVLITLAVSAASPFIIGSNIESTARQQVELTQQNLQTAVESVPYITHASFELESYEKSYLQATAKNRLRLETIIPTEEGEPLVLDIPLISQITHGPYLGEGVLGLAKVLSRLDIDQMALPKSITADTLTVEDTIDFTGQVKEVITVLPIKHGDETGTVLEFMGMQAQLATSTSNRLTFSGDIAVETLKVENAAASEYFYLHPFKIDLQSTGEQATSTGEYQLRTTEIKGEAQNGLGFSLASLATSGTYEGGHAKNSALLMGRQEMTVSDIQINNPAALPDAIKVPALKIMSALEQDGEEDISFLARYSAVLDPDSMAALQLPVAVNTAQFDMKVRAVPLSLLEDYMAMVGKLANTATSESLADEDVAAMQEQGVGLLQKAINNAMQTSLQVKLGNDEGALDTKLTLGFSPEGELNQDEVTDLIARAGIDPAMLLDVLSGEGYLHLDKPVTDSAQLTEMVEMMGAGFVRLDGDIFKSELLIENGQLLINGEPLFGAGMGR